MTTRSGARLHKLYCQLLAGRGAASSSSPAAAARLAPSAGSNDGSKRSDIFSKRASAPRFANGELGVMLVTGATSGVGKCVAETYAALGWQVAAVARRHEVLAAMAADPASCGNLHPFVCDVADSAAVAAMVEAVEAALGPIDVLVSNAALDIPGSLKFVEVAAPDIDKVIDVNVKGMMYVTHAVLQRMVRRDYGHIFGVASVAGTHGMVGQSVYCTSKHAMVGFMDSIANETRDTGVRATAHHTCSATAQNAIHPA